MDKATTDGPVLVWETLNTRREEDGILDSKYLTECAKGPGGGWKVFYVVAPGGLCFWFGERLSRTASVNAGNTRA